MAFPPSIFVRFQFYVLEAVKNWMMGRLENDATPNEGYKGHLLCTDANAITSYKIRARPCKSSDVISLKYTDIRGVF